jgi:hypothetical protein
MSNQLRLRVIDNTGAGEVWKLDESTRQRGLEGVARARAALAAARPAHRDGDEVTGEADAA